MFKYCLGRVSRGKNKIQGRERIIDESMGSGVKRGMCLMRKIRGRKARMQVVKLVD